MRNIKTIFILVLSLILFAVSCSNEDKTGGETDNTETIETIDAKDFPTDTELSELLGTYRDNASKIPAHDTKVSYDASRKKIKIEGHWFIDGESDVIKQSFYIEKWTKTTKRGGKIIKLEGEYVKGEEKYTIIYDYASGTLSGTYAHSDGTKASFNGKKIS